jgi:hypothetical protein
LNKTLTLTNIIFLITLWTGAFTYLYGAYNLGFFSGFHPSENWPLLDLILKMLAGVLMLSGPVLLLTLSLLFAPRSIIIKFIITFTTLSAVIVSLHGDQQGVLLFLYMLLSWLVSIGTLIFASIQKSREC